MRRALVQRNNSQQKISQASKKKIIIFVFIGKK